MNVNRVVLNFSCCSTAQPISMASLSSNLISPPMHPVVKRTPPIGSRTKLKMSSSKVIIRQLTTPSVNSPTHSPNNNDLVEPNSENILNKQSREHFPVLLEDMNR